MRLEPLCEFDIGYTTEFVLLQPFGTEEGAAYGEGDGRVSGRLTGTVRWINHARRRSDATMLPDTHGLIETDDGPRVWFHLYGRTPTVGPTAWQQLLRIEFVGDGDYEWLNLVFAVAEGRVNAETMRALIRAYECVHELQ